MAVDGKSLKDQTFDNTSFIVPGDDCKLQEKNISTKNLGVEERCACQQFWHNPYDNCWESAHRPRVIFNQEQEGSILPRGGELQDSSPARNPGSKMEKETFDFP